MAVGSKGQALRLCYRSNRERLMVDGVYTDARGCEIGRVQTGRLRAPEIWLLTAPTKSGFSWAQVKTRDGKRYQGHQALRRHALKRQATVSTA